MWQLFSGSYAIYDLLVYSIPGLLRLGSQCRSRWRIGTVNGLAGVDSSADIILRDHGQSRNQSMWSLTDDGRSEHPVA